MGFIQSIFGANTGAGYTAGGTTAGDLQNAQGQVNQSLGQQQTLANQTAAQNGLGNQSQVFQQQQALSGQLGQLAQGQGPNPALNQLNQSTASNIQNQAALAASQRGASANAGLLARQVGQQGAATQQQAVGQAATQSAQQQLGYTNALQQQQTNMANLATQQVGQQLGAANSQAQTALGGQSNLLGLQSNINTTQAGIAQANQKAQAGLVGGIIGSVGAAGTSGASSYAHGGEVQGYAQGGAVDQNQVLMPNAQGQMTGGQATTAPRSTSGQYLTGGQGLTQSPDQSMRPGGQALGNLAIKGGKALYGWATGPSSSATPAASVGGADAGSTDLAGSAAGDAAGGDAATAAGGDDAALLFAADGGQVDSGPIHDPEDPLGFVMSYLDKGGMAKLPTRRKTVNGADGKVVPGKAAVHGDSLKNDKVPARLSPGEIVIPRSIAQGPNAPAQAAKFVQAVLAKQGLKRKQ